MNTEHGPIVAVLIHVADWPAALAWYERAFPTAVRVKPDTTEWECLKVDGVQIELVQADEKVSAGTAGTVVYWFTQDFAARRAQLESLGAVLYRGPLRIEDGMSMCQFKEPFGNLIGIRGQDTVE